MGVGIWSPVGPCDVRLLDEDEEAENDPSILACTGRSCTAKDSTMYTLVFTGPKQILCMKLMI